MQYVSIPLCSLEIPLNYIFDSHDSFYFQVNRLFPIPTFQRCAISRSETRMFRFPVVRRGIQLASKQKIIYVRREITIALKTYRSSGFIRSFIRWRTPCSPFEVYESEQVPGTQVSMFVCCLDKYVVVLPAFQLLLFTLMPRNFVLEAMEQSLRPLLCARFQTQFEDRTSEQ